MNIFYLDSCPRAAAVQQCDKHVVKMILESAQMLSTAHHEHNSSRAVYKTTHKNHPSTVWTRESVKHYNWLYAHMKALSEEYTHRYGRVHLTWQKCQEALREPPEAMPDLEWREPPQCMPDECKRASAVDGYRVYYRVKSDTIDMRWTNATKHFFEEEHTT